MWGDDTEIKSCLGSLTPPSPPTSLPPSPGPRPCDFSASKAADGAFRFFLPSRTSRIRFPPEHHLEITTQTW